MKLDKIIKTIGGETKDQLDTSSTDQLTGVIVRAEQAMDDVAFELESNPKYQELKESLQAISAGKKEVNKRQKAIIAYCLHLLRGDNGQS